MPSRRFRLVAYENYKPRDNLDVPNITQLLKQLKSNSRNVRSSQKLLFAEMHILERVYYKGKNQHGLSLFWRSVVSVRRMSARIHETNLPRLLEILGGLFHEEAFEGQKVFSGAWTRLPPPESIAQILERLIDIGSLLKSALVAFEKAYRAFSLAMPNTAFLQLTVILVSIVSRTNALASAFSDNLSLIVPHVYAVFQVLEPPEVLQRRLSKLLKNFTAEPTHPDPAPNAAPHVPPIPDLMQIDSQDQLEDLGASVARSTLPLAAPLPPPVNPSQIPMATLPFSAHPPPPPVAIDIETTTPSSPPPVPSQPVPESPQTFPVEAEAPAGRAALISVAAPRMAVATSTNQGKKKRKKARNEIDDIFG